jgi:hypothetical protein
MPIFAVFKMRCKHFELLTALSIWLSLICLSINLLLQPPHASEIAGTSTAAATKNRPANVLAKLTPLQEKFEAYQRGLEENRFIRDAITRRRFHMAC